MEKVKKEAEERMGKVISALEKEFSGLRSGRAGASMVENIKVDYYGTLTPINQIGSVSVPDSRTLTIQPWEKKALGPVEKAILAANIGLTPMNDGRLIRITIPDLTEERRKDLVKVARRYAEESRVAVRNIRRDANEALRKMEKDKILSEDDAKKAQDGIQKLTDAYVARVEQSLQAKEKEILSI
ncbi:MAG: ribosome recycling factor [Deltaproteobacteria bacterium]|jgi:ribosome recycling factor|nr:ribosome recycling factor [Deltaproteobacteria bacterium]